MKGNFEQCLAWLLKHEGGFSAHPEDPGHDHEGHRPGVMKSGCPRQWTASRLSQKKPAKHPRQSRRSDLPRGILEPGSW